MVFVVAVVVVGNANQASAGCTSDLSYSNTMEEIYISNTPSINHYTVTIKDITPNRDVLYNGQNYTLKVFVKKAVVITGNLTEVSATAQDGVVIFNVDENTYPKLFKVAKNGNTFRAEFNYGRTGLNGITGCMAGTYSISTAKVKEVFISQNRDTDGDGFADAVCYGGSLGGCLNNSKVVVQSKIIDANNNPITNKNVTYEYHIGRIPFLQTDTTDGDGLSSIEIEKLVSGDYTIKIIVDNFAIYQSKFVINNNCASSNPYQCVQKPTNLILESGSIVEEKKFKICNQIDAEKFQDLKDKCRECVGGDDGRAGVWTAIGCVKKDPVEIVQNLIKIGLGMGGGVALLMILASGFVFSTSQGDPKKTGDAKEMLVAAITGLLFIIFSVTILEFIGYSVFRIPGFGG